ISPHSKIMAIKSSLTTTNIIKGINFAQNNGAKIINASWGGSYFDETLRASMASFTGLFIVAAGNCGGSNYSLNGCDVQNQTLYPAAFDLPNIISVAATDQNDALASFSNYDSSSVDVGAPGTNIYSTIGPAESYTYSDGTSMAAPYVAGLAALIEGYNPNLSSLELKNIILISGDSIASLSGKTYTGKRINAYNSLYLANYSNTVLPSSQIKKGGDVVNIISSGNIGNNIWFAPANTNFFVEGNNMTKAVNGTSTSILAPTPEGVYKLFVVDSQNHIFTSSSILSVDTTPPALPVIASIAADNIIDNNEKSAIHIVGTAEANSLVAVSLTDGTNTKTGSQQLSGGSVDYDIVIDGTTAIPASLNDVLITVSVVATDAVGNNSTPATLTASQNIFSISSIETKDLNTNGKIDALKITFNKNINDSTVLISDFNISGYTIDTFSSYTNGDILNDNIIYLKLFESGVFDSGITPTVVYTKGSLSTTLGNLLSSNSISPTDKINPIVSKLGDGASDLILPIGDTDLIFSEVLSDTTKTNVQKALSSGADKTLNYLWSGGTLTINATEATTFANDVIVDISDLSNNSNLSLMVVDSILEINQTSPNEAGIATVNNVTPKVIITNPNQPVSLTVDTGTINPTINVKSFVLNGTGILPAITINSINTNNINVAIPAGVTVTSSVSNWDGEIITPITTTANIPVVSGVTKIPSITVELGVSNIRLYFDKAVRILFPDESGKRAGYTVDNGSTFTEITSICSSDNQSAGDALPVESDCLINSGSDLVIWTKHFSTFSTYTQTINPVSSGGGGGGGGGGGSSFTPVISTKAVRYLYKNQFNKKIEYINPTNNISTEINSICQSDSQTVNDLLLLDTECKINSSGDLIVWARYSNKNILNIKISSNTIVDSINKDEGIIYYPITIPSYTFTNILSLGSKGNETKELQKFLINKGYLKGVADGIFGKGTQSAVKIFQSVNNLKIDGVISGDDILVLNKKDITPNPIIDKSDSGCSPGDVFNKITGAVCTTVVIEPVKNKRTLKLGMTGNDVKELQIRLKSKGYFTGITSGVFGKITLVAVKKFQSDQLFKADGIAGPKTMLALGN
ncbi:MAG: S8 family serine peptidase, partial [Candidatus Nomurabacteria bacterium]|nr:S8 family serine peptidase [Candidatus Nomurabacteria bacterium]